jgi:cytochrome c oxidase cbb3-type subunit 3
MRKTTFSGLVIVSIYCCAALPAAEKPSLGSTSVLFHRACAVCHGQKGHGGRGPDLVSGRWSHGSTDADLARVIRNGVPGSDMPAFGDRFTNEEITKLAAFVRSLSAGEGNVKITGNAARGQQIYWGKGGCSQCHMVAGQGGTLGPDLTRIGAQRSPASLKESIVSPSAAIATGFQTVKLTHGGRTITGIRKNEDNFTIQVYDGERNYSFQKSEIEVLEEPKESLMPPSSLGPSEVDDVVAYLDTLRGRR